MAFFGLLALIPAIAVAVSIYGLVSDPNDIQHQIDSLGTAIPEEARDLVTTQLSRIVEEPSGDLTMAAVLAFVIAVWSASSGTKHLLSAINAAYDEVDERGFVHTRGVALALTLGSIAFLVSTVIVITVLPSFAARTGAGWFVSLISLARWPLLALAMMTGLGVIYRFGPDRVRPGVALGVARRHRRHRRVPTRLDGVLDLQRQLRQLQRGVWGSGCGGCADAVALPHRVLGHPRC